MVIAFADKLHRCFFFLRLTILRHIELLIEFQNFVDSVTNAQPISIFQTFFLKYDFRKNFFKIFFFPVIAINFYKIFQKKKKLLKL